MARKQEKDELRGETLLSNLPHTPANSIIRQRISFIHYGWPEINPDVIQQMSKLSDVELAQVGTAAALLGDQRIVKLAVEKLDGKTVVLEQRGDEVWGRLCDHEPFLVPAEMCKLLAVKAVDFHFDKLDLLVQSRKLFGGADLLGCGPYGGFLEKSIPEELDSNHLPPFAKSRLPLPALEDDIVSTPGLLEVLLAKGAGEGVDPGWFDDILCTAPVDMVDAYRGKLIPLNATARLLGTVAGSSAEKSVTLVGERGQNEVARLDSATEFEIGLQSDGKPLNAIDFSLVYMFCGYEAPAALSVPEGHVLCRTSARFLDSFPREPEPEFDLYASLLKDYLPLPLLGIKYQVANGRRLGTARKSELENKYSVAGVCLPSVMPAHSAIYSALGNPAMTEKIKQATSQRALRALVEGAGGCWVTAREFQNLALNYGYVSRFKTVQLDLDGHEVAMLERNGLRMPGANFVVSSWAEHRLNDVAARLFRRTLAMTDGPSTLNDLPTDMPAADLYALWKLENHPVVRFLMLTQGLEAMAPAFVTRCDWEAAADIFGADVVGAFDPTLLAKVAQKPTTDGPGL